jgi:hypothetical protein
MNAQGEIITSLETTSGEVYEGHHFCSLVDQDLKQNLLVNNLAGIKAMVMAAITTNWN